MEVFFFVVGFFCNFKKKLIETPCFLMIKTVVACIFLLTLNTFSQSAQSSEVDALLVFDAVLGSKNTGLINGVEYINTYNTKEGFDQYYKTSKFLTGNLVYDNQHYFNVNLLYDIYSDDLIYGFYENDLVLYIKLVKDKVSCFTIDNKSFEKLTINENEEAGYFEIVNHDNGVVLYKKHHKNISKRIDLKQVYYEFIEKSSYFIEMDGSYFKVDNKSSITKLFPDKKKLINSYYSKNRFLLKNNLDQFMVKLFRDVILS